MTNSSIEYNIKRKKLYDSIPIAIGSKPDQSFKTLTVKRVITGPIGRQLLLPNTKLYPSTWTYLVSNDKHPHTITLAEFRKKKLKDGDKVYFERGHIYNFAEYNITVNNVTFSSYGSGADPIFRGSDPSVTFTSEAGGYYSMPLATAPLWVANPAGEMARQGETDWITTTAAATGTTLTADAATLNAFNAVQSLVNAKFRHKEFNFRLSYEHNISGYSAGVITSSAIVGGASGLPFKLYDQLQFATLEGDWWYDTANAELWIKTASDPTGLGWRVVTENYAFKVTGSGVTISNIEFTQYFESAIEAEDAASLTLSGFNIHDNRQNALLIYGNAGTLAASNFTIQRCGLQGIHLGAITNSTITNFTIDEVGEQLNIGWPVDTYWIKTGGCGIAYFWDSAETVTTPVNVDVSGGTITNMGYMGILMVGDDHNIFQNLVDTFCTRWNDGGGIYSVHRSALGPSSKNILMSYNVVRNGIGNTDGITGSQATHFVANGIYQDNGSELNTIDHNVSYNNNGVGVQIGRETQKITVTNNLLYGNKLSQIIFKNDITMPLYPATDGIIMEDNILVSTSTQYCAEVVDANGDANYDPFADGGSCSNNYYVRPYGTLINISRATITGTPTAYSLATFTTKYGGTGSVEVVNQYSYMSPAKSAIEVPIAVNLTGSAVNVNPGAGYEDLDGNSLGIFSLDPFQARAYLVTTTTTPDLLLDHFTGANGTAIAGRTPAVGPIPTIVAGTHTIQANRMASNPGGLVYWGVGTADFEFTASRRITNTSSAFLSYVRYTDANNHLIVSLNATNQQLVIFERNADPTAVELLNTHLEVLINTEYFVTVRCVGSNMKVYVDGKLFADLTVAVTTGNNIGVQGTTNITTDYVQAETP